jgi:asparagine synthase (glutamine-hydrolysing)
MLPLAISPQLWLIFLHLLIQPFIIEDLGLTIVFNGEIYNYQELKRSYPRIVILVALTQVLLKLIRVWRKLTEHLRGMFTFFIFNHEPKDICIEETDSEKTNFFYSDSHYVLPRTRCSEETFFPNNTINQEIRWSRLDGEYVYKLTAYISGNWSISTCSTTHVENGKWDTYYRFPKVADYNPGFESLKSQVKENYFKLWNGMLVCLLLLFYHQVSIHQWLLRFQRRLKPDILAITMSTGEAAFWWSYGRNRGICQNSEFIRKSSKSTQVLWAQELWKLCSRGPMLRWG